ncbi:MAG: stress response translation initiation inhibitor YciH [Planctomycetota bacterium]
MPNPRRRSLDSQDFNARAVFSSDEGDISRRPAEEAPANVSGDGVVRIRRETAHRGGKTVTVVLGLPLAPKELKALAKKLKAACGTGGSTKDGVVEIQGDHREKIKATLERLGYVVKLAGG